MILRNGNVLTDAFTFEKLDVAVENGRITAIAPHLEGDGRDAAGCYVVPGFVDIHVHGGVGADASDADAAGLERMAAFLYTKGVTTFCPTTMTIAEDELIAALQTIVAVQKKQKDGLTAKQARIAGVHVEGPFINVSKKGAQRADCVLEPDWDTFLRLYEACNGQIKQLSMAPECDKTGLAQRASALCTVSIAHTNANYAQAKEAFAHGVTHATHLFNAMSGLHHRDPGVVGAVFDTPSVCGELICDGQHIHPAVLRLAFAQLKGRVAVVSDAMRASGLKEGEYDLGGQQVFVKDGKATLADGTIAGSVTNLLEELHNLVRFGVPLEDALRAMTLTPTREIHEDAEIGSITVGKRADLLVLNEALEIVDRVDGQEKSKAEER